LYQFIKTKRFLELRNWVEGYEASENDQIIIPQGYGPSPSAPPGLEADSEIGGAYMTVSQQANEKVAALAKEKLQRQVRGET
jgi:hypothetical protein